jgi:hypothetical protein
VTTGRAPSLLYQIDWEVSRQALSLDSLQAGVIDLNHAGSSLITAQQEAIGDDGFLRDIEVMDIDAPARPRRENKSCDIDHFFSETYTSGDKRFRSCKKCL